MTTRTEIQKPEPTPAQPLDPAYEAALRGADFLDRELGPNWEDRVKPQKLNMRRTDRCVLGQVFGRWWAPCGYYRGTRLLELNRGRERGRLGFNTFSSAPAYEPLTAAWLRVLSEREAARKGEGA